MKTSLEHKTIRPGSLSDYSFYYSNRRAPQAEPAQASPQRRSPVAVLLIVAVVGAAGFFGWHAIRPADQRAASKNAPVISGATGVNPCSGNSLSKFIKVSVSKRQLWACSGTKVAYTTPVITGIEKYPSTVTPLGSYKIYSKQQDTVLTGSDQTGSWRDPVSYWMPFLDNQYGTYGFHDATWRNPKQFGKVDPSSDSASHGCVELPIDAAGWLYNWSNVGTMLTIAA